MFIQKHILREGEPGKSGSGGDTAEFEAKIAELQAENERMRKHQEKLLDETKSAKAALKAFEGIDPDKIKQMMKTIESSEEAKLLAEGKLDDVVNKRTEKIRLEFEEFKNSSKELIDQANKNAESFKNRYNSERISLSLRQAAEKSGALPDAIDDIINRASGVFSIGEDNAIEARDKDGNLVTVKGKPLDPVIFIEQLKDSAAHFWPASEGHGGSGKRFSKNTKNPFKKGPDYNLTEQAKLRKSDPELAEQLKAAAG